MSSQDKPKQYANLPENWDEMSDEEKTAWALAVADEILGETSSD